ncbi:MAG: BamA/TamA family outer membrane protein, partial [Paludibacter sp.]|nr:BamA/TamA family outer membrane protein [Paludibacter sp.]
NNAPGLLDVTALMTPMSKYTFRAELDLVTKSNKYSGPQLNLSVLNRNTFKGAELLSLNMAGTFEAQLTRMAENLFSYSWNPDIELTFPRFIVPFKLKPTNSLYVPKTRFVLSYNYMNRVNYFDMNTFKFGYGFKWKNNVKNEHEFNPVNISYTSIGNRSAQFDSLMLSNPLLEKSYEEQFIAGANYSFTYNEQLIPGKRIQYYINLNVETAGNALSLARLIGGAKASPEQPLKVIGSVYSQYAKLSVDGRATLNLSDKDKLALRAFAGVARSYGNSSVLPYSKQFFSGGPNSIRAFQINSLGPGTYHQQNINRYLQSGGDIKLEANAEYRFNIYKYFKGALFVDAGNVWLQKSNPSDIGTPFRFSSFMNELAVGAGAGLRVDVSFFVLRFDLAIPLRKPWPTNQRWVTSDIDFTDATWRRENLMLNIAIGYPF